MNERHDSNLDALRAAQARARAELLDPQAIHVRQQAGAELASDHEWRKGLFGRATRDPKKPYRDDPARRRRR